MSLHMNWDEAYSAIDVDSPRYLDDEELVTLEFTTSSARPCNFEHVYLANTRQSFVMLFTNGIRRGLALNSILNRNTKRMQNETEKDYCC